MSIEARCANGHLLKVKNSFAGKTGLCPICRALVKVPERKTPGDDDALKMLGDAAVGGATARPTPPPPPNAPTPAPEPAGSHVPRPHVEPPPLPSSRKQKICPNCNQAVSYFYAAHCPRCGASLKGVKGPSS